MKLRPDRKSPQKKGYDYRRAGAYFVSICTHERELTFGDVVDNILSNPARWDKDRFIR